ncbi:uncharacterized protein HKW66_Vig0236710 [Vigna angularis]|uniref:Uncharacterized protein n=1 Tax=Phaseolus angularis TaxID=3914 RepID=A0A8T0KRY9_PHAAN|nr:uncharacterized protein HKW66_Vig0236710 [Vigna angularis]
MERQRGRRDLVTSETFGVIGPMMMVSPNVVVLVDSEGWADMATAAASSFRHGVVSSLEYYSMILELLDVSTAGGGEWVRRIEMIHL